MLFSADGKTLAFQRNTQPTEITLFEVATGQPKGSIAIPKQNKNVDPIGLQGAFSPDGRGLAVISERKVTLYDLATGQPRLTFDAEVASQSTVITTHGYVVAFSPDGNRLAIAGAKNLVHLADVATGRDLATFQGHTGALTGVAFAPDGKTIASSSNDGTVLIWDVTKVERHGQ
jgi:WD40 repeat protein